MKNYSAKMSKKTLMLWKKLLTLNGSGYFTEYGEDLNVLKQAVDELGPKEFIEEIEGKWEQAGEGYREELTDESWDTEYIRMLTRDKDKLDDTVWRFIESFKKDFKLK